MKVIGYKFKIGVKFVGEICICGCMLEFFNDGLNVKKNFDFGRIIVDVFYFG